MAPVPALARLLTFLEKYVFSFCFLYLWAYPEFEVLRTRLPLYAEQNALGLGSAGLFAVTVKHLLLFTFALFVGVGLLLNRAPVRQPERLRDIVVPILGTFFQFTFRLTGAAPAALTQSLIPAAFRNAAAVAAVVVSLVGYGIAAWAVLSLGRSFSLLVAVRTVVHGGAYRRVRHPMYLGYLLLFAGLLLAAPSVLSLALSTMYLVLTVYRARLEEEALGRHSAAYRDYAARTGFLLPRLRAPAPASG
jgi:protein-S-isoprenylcysteine O-methyltransferase Ste14